LILHALNAGLVYALIFLLTRNIFSAVAVSLLFGIHPTHVAWNVLHYFLELQWPWMIVLLFAGCLIAWRAYGEWKKIRTS
jgi:hypothetical protein